METLWEQTSPFSTQDSPLLKHFSSQAEERGFTCYLSKASAWFMVPTWSCRHGVFLTSPHISMQPGKTKNFSMRSQALWPQESCWTCSVFSNAQRTPTIAKAHCDTGQSYWGVNSVWISVNLGHNTEILRWLLKPILQSLTGTGIVGWTRDL